MARRTQEKTQHDLHSYAVLRDQISRLVALARTQDSNIGAMVLYGSIARLRPHRNSDVDLLILCWEPRAFIEAAEDSGRGIYLIVEVTRPDEEWSLSPMVTDLHVSDLPEALLANIVQEGVLLYQQEGITLPNVLAELIPSERWAERVAEKLKHAQVA
jgi:predicted nucleotidyltransferase